MLNIYIIYRQMLLSNNINDVLDIARKYYKKEKDIINLCDAIFKHILQEWH